MNNNVAAADNHDISHVSQGQVLAESTLVNKIAAMEAEVSSLETK